MRKLLAIELETDLIPFETLLKNIKGVDRGMSYLVDDSSEYIIKRKYESRYEILRPGSVEMGIRGYEFYKTFEQLKENFKIIEKS